MSSSRGAHFAFNFSIVGDDDGGKVFSPEEFEQYKKKVLPMVSIRLMAFTRIMRRIASQSEDFQCLDMHAKSEGYVIVSVINTLQLCFIGACAWHVSF